MLELFIPVLLVVSIMILVMFLTLKKTVKILNEQSKGYFLTKLQTYDSLIEKKENELKILNEQIKNSKKQIKQEKDKKKINIDNDVDLDIKLPNYRNDEIFKNYEIINKTFDFDNKKILLDFINSNIIEEDTKVFEILTSVKNKFNYDFKYKLINLESKEQVTLILKTLNFEERRIFEGYIKNSKEKFNLTSFIDYLEKQLVINDPTIYVWVGNKNENYNYLNKNIKTIYSTTIYLGMIIGYKDMLYDYSLR